MPECAGTDLAHLRRAATSLFVRPARASGRDTEDVVKRTVFETALVMMVLVLGLEVVHYRNAVLEANVDRKNAWHTVVELRRKCEVAGVGADHPSSHAAPAER
jgi:hypothetical protein